MGCPREISELARRKLEEKREKVRIHTTQIRSAVSARAPRALEIEKEIAKTSSMLTGAALSGVDVAKKIQQIRQFNLKKQQELADVLVCAGFDSQALSPHYYCDKCHDTGILGTRVCDCVKCLERELLLERLGASCFQIYSFEDFDLNYYDKNTVSGFSPFEIMTRAFNICKAFAENFSLCSHNMLMSGGPGLGKTHLSLSIAREVIQKNHDVVYASFQTLLTQLESSRFKRNDNDYSDDLYAPLNCELLILDDLGSEFGSPFGASVLYQVINGRLLSGYPTIINTNLTHTEISRRYGDRIGSRIFGCYQVVLFAGDDVRIQKMYAK